jgi:ribosome-associated protein
MTEPANQSDKIFQSDVRIVEISREPVELYKILKFEGMVASGGQAKAVVAAGQVLVNGKVETRKGKKIVTGDTIEFNNEKIGIKLT